MLSRKWRQFGSYYITFIAICFRVNTGNLFTNINDYLYMLEKQFFIWSLAYLFLLKFENWTYESFKFHLVREKSGDWENYSVVDGIHCSWRGPEYSSSIPISWLSYHLLLQFGRLVPFPDTHGHNLNKQAHTHTCK